MAKRKGGREEAGGAGSTGDHSYTTLPAWLPWGLYGALSLLLFGAFVFSSQMLFGSDTLGLGYTTRQFYAEAVRSGDFPLWYPNLLGGVPFLEAISGGDSLYPTALLLFVMAPYRALGWKLVLHVFSPAFSCTAGRVAWGRLAAVRWWLVLATCWHRSWSR